MVFILERQLPPALANGGFVDPMPVWRGNGNGRLRSSKQILDQNAPLQVGRAFKKWNLAIATGILTSLHT